MAPTKRAPSKPAKSPKSKSKPASKSHSSKSRPKPPTPTQQKSKRPAPPSAKARAKACLEKIKSQYTPAQLGVPTLNTTIPAGVQKAKRGKQRNKVFVDDPRSMMAILAVVNAEKEGKIEAKMVKARELEEIREARRAELERRESVKRGVVEGVKGELRRERRGRKRKRERGGMVNGGVEEKEVEAGKEKDGGDGERVVKKVKKRVSFA